MNSMEKDCNKIYKYLQSIIEDNDLFSNGSKIYKIALENPESWDYVVNKFRDYNGDIDNVIQMFLEVAQLTNRERDKEMHSTHGYLMDYKYYLNLEKFWYSVSCNISTINENVSSKTKKTLLHLNEEYGFITFEQKWKIVNSLVAVDDEWAKKNISIFYVSSVISNNNLFPNNDLNMGYVITKNIVQDLLKKYTDSYISLISDEYEKLDDIPYIENGAYKWYSSERLLYDTVILYGFGHICIRNKKDDELAYLSLKVSDKIVRKINELNSGHSDNYYYKEYVDYLSTVFGCITYCRSFCCMPSDKDMGELCYRIGINFEKRKSIEDSKQAIEFYKLAANYGNPEAMYALAKIYYSDSGVIPKNEKNARFWINKAVENDVVEAIQFLNEHPELKEGVKNVTYHADGDIIQGNRGIIAKDDAIVNRSNVYSENDFFEDIPADNHRISKEEISKSEVLNNDYIFCIECGTKLPANAKFCFNCGKKV